MLWFVLLFGVAPLKCHVDFCTLEADGVTSNLEISGPVAQNSIHPLNWSKGKEAKEILKNDNYKIEMMAIIEKAIALLNT